MLPSAHPHLRLSLAHLLRLLSTSTPALTATTPPPTPTPTPTESNPPPPPRTQNALRFLLRRETDPDRALSLLSSLPSDFSSKYKFSVDYVARRFSLSSRFDDAAKLLDSHIPGAIAESDFTFLLASYGRANIPDRALSAFKARIADGSLAVSVRSFNALLSAFCQSGYYHQVPHLFTSLSEEYHISPNAVSYVILVKSLGRTGKIQDALVTVKLMREEKGISPTPAIYGTLISSLYKLNKPEEAKLLWNEMVEAGCKPDDGVYTARISYHASRAETDKVLELIKEMETAGVKPDTITYNFLMTCHVKNEHWEDAKKVYEQTFLMKVCNPNAATFRILLEGFSQGGDFETGLMVLFKSLKKNKVPHFAIVRTFVEGLVKDGKADRAKAVVKQIRKRFHPYLTDRWKQVEKDLGLSSDADETASDGTGGG
ncbi:Pentatricopeptide repeat (PPR) superfamily protein [Rhynchospora pubera]|uniref:Pentatricopeptide repeat (PPR) superfamily protein n=1 Tax=Rhynchospora pubera TaxID=906938 RepID=A0AAV8FRJ5_9POAL|nr:Pentatricopeptide repeat (PPR) superfamily protein [Rhynchospora pubera]